MSYDINKYGNKIKDLVIYYAKEYNCQKYDYIYEFEGNKQIKRSHCIISIVFSQEHINKFKEFINTIKRIKKLYLEVIYNDNNEILYASSFYKKRNKDVKIKKDENELAFLF